MIRSHFGLQRNPFDMENLSLLEHQQQVLDILRVHAQQGGLCLVLGEPGTGKSVLKEALVNHDPKCYGPQCRCKKCRSYAGLAS